jgi:hypothetical protein
MDRYIISPIMTFNEFVSRYIILYVECSAEKCSASILELSGSESAGPREMGVDSG